VADIVAHDDRISTIVTLAKQLEAGNYHDKEKVRLINLAIYQVSPPKKGG